MKQGSGDGSTDAAATAISAAPALSTPLKSSKSLGDAVRLDVALAKEKQHEDFQPKRNDTVTTRDTALTAGEGDADHKLRSACDNCSLKKIKVSCVRLFCLSFFSQNLSQVSRIRFWASSNFNLLEEQQARIAASLKIEQILQHAMVKDLMLVFIT